jgi:hypothetical protein
MVMDDDMGHRPRRRAGTLAAPFVLILALASAGACSDEESVAGPVECGELGAEAPEMLFPAADGQQGPEPEELFNNPDLNCTIPNPEGGARRRVGVNHYTECSDGSALTVVDRRNLDGLPEDDQVQVWGRTGQAWQPGEPSDDDRRDCEGPSDD